LPSRSEPVKACVPPEPRRSKCTCMPRITPALIADFIEESFDELRDRGGLGTVDQGSLQTIGIVVAMLDRLDDGVLAGLPLQQYRDTVVATEYLRTTVSRWQYPQPAGRGHYAIVPFQPLGNRHPVVVIRDVMRAAPEEPIAAVQPRLAFLRDPPLQESIATDVASAESALVDGRYKNACVMSGAAIEALLLWAVHRRNQGDHQAAFGRAQTRRALENRQPLGAVVTDPRRWTLEQYIEVARELPVLSSTPADAAMLAKDFRNLIHPGRAERLQQQATRGSATQGLAAATLVAEDLADRVRMGQL
jgi:hypothetical protein